MAQHIRAICLSLTFLLVTLSAWGQAAPDTSERPPATASDGGNAVLLAPRPVPADSDSVTQRVVADTAEGLVIVVTIDGANVSLDSATPARIPTRRARADRNIEGDAVKATAFAGGQVIGSTVVPDNVINIQEGRTGVVRTERRQISIGLLADRPIDTVSIEAPATGASASLDVRPAYARLCELDRNSKWCRR
jgi:hypothetical protein